MQRMLLGLMLLTPLALGGSASALCTCSVRDGCSSAAACDGKIPGDECGNNRTCKIVVGTGTDLSCCCGCSKGVGPTGCNYGTLGAIDLPSETACGSEAVGKLVAKTETAVNANLGKADAACVNEKNALKMANAARGKLGRLHEKIEKAAQKGKIDSTCAATSLALLDAVSAQIDDVEAGNAPGGPVTTSTTSTTLPGTPSCSATFTTFPTDPAEVDFVLGCFAAGTEYQGFQLTMNGGREVTTYLQPPGFVCMITTENTSNDSLACIGNFNIDVQVTGGRIRTNPAPVSGMDASLFVQVGSWVYGPFPTTGP